MSETKTKKAPRRVKFDKILQNMFLDLIRKGVGRTNACSHIGISRSTLKRAIDTNEDFLAALHEAEMDANEAVEMAMYRTAISGNVTAQQVWLYNRSPDRWADKRNIQMSGPGGRPIQSDISLTNISPEELDQRIMERYSLLGYAAATGGPQKTTLSEAKAKLGGESTKD